MHSPVTVDILDTLNGDQAASIARLTRDAYRHSDPVSGLPAADGASESREDVLESLGKGGLVWLARDLDGRMCGALRLRPDVPGWWVSRVAVHPGAWGQGVGGQLLSAAAGYARSAGASALFLNAVVERESPRFYARRGFLVRLRWPAPDKPLTEVTMVRDTGGHHRPVNWPWQGDGALATDAAVLT